MTGKETSAVLMAAHMRYRELADRFPNVTDEEEVELDALREELGYPDPFVMADAAARAIARWRNTRNGGSVMKSPDQILAMAEAARALNEPDAAELNAEYVRGQVNLIADMAGLPGVADLYHDLLTDFITHKISAAEFMYQLGGIRA